MAVLVIKHTDLCTFHVLIFFIVIPHTFIVEPDPLNLCMRTLKCAQQRTFVTEIV